ncbi:MAG: hypothetical protein EZS28_012192 [Streblomastix strix]|uniref:Uncharacterized protein n=1 Tax=Streblomastix strix TaxID=222440 RepID=A0A5J4WCJ5_9EUKA|nr:MAG: hypothetical protein EZS28_012192 [Streblomastix strix]
MSDVWGFSDLLHLDSIGLPTPLDHKQEVQQVNPALQLRRTLCRLSELCSSSKIKSTSQISERSSRMISAVRLLPFVMEAKTQKINQH